MEALNMQKDQTKKIEELGKLDKIKIGYARVSTLDQNLGFSEKQSGDNDNRPELTNAIFLAKQLAKQDKVITLQIYKLDRLTRKMLTLANIIDESKEKRKKKSDSSVGGSGKDKNCQTPRQ